MSQPDFFNDQITILRAQSRLGWEVHEERELTVTPRDYKATPGERWIFTSLKAHELIYDGVGPAQPPCTPEPPAHRAPGQLVNCDAAGCWGAQNGVHYNLVAGGNLQGTDGSFCTRGRGNTFSCN